MLARNNVKLAASHDRVMEAQLEENDPHVDNNLKKLQEVYGKEYLDNLSDRDLYALYRKHAIWT